MDCETCIHKSVCRIKDTKSADFDCKEYISIDHFIKLPCKLGEKIYAIVEKKKTYKNEKYRYIQPYYLSYSNIERVTKNFGKTIFLTPEDAKETLAKMDCNID